VCKIFSLFRDIIGVGGDVALLSFDILYEFFLGLNLFCLFICQGGLEVSEDLDEEIAYLFNLIVVNEFRACEGKQGLDESTLDRVFAINVLDDLFNRLVEFLELDERSLLVELVKDAKCFLDGGDAFVVLFNAFKE
jgi:hypothetical protein